jgi:uncharacterized protein YbaP (TraB family)
MRTRLPAVLLAVLFLAPLPAVAGDEGLFLWQARSDKATVYLLGSVHAAKADIYPLDRAITSAWDASPALVVEVDLNSADMASVQSKLLTVGMCGPDESLEKLVSKETWALLESHCKARGMSSSVYNGMKPWLTAMFLTVTELARSGYREDLGIDRHFLARAAAEGKEVLQLETAEFQLEMLSGFSDKLQDLFLVSVLRDIDDFEKHLEAIFTSWKTGDVAGMENVFFEAVREDKRIEPVIEKVIYERNVGMADKVAGYLRDGRSCFVVVGAGHLAGKRSVIDLLERMDGATWTVTRVAPAGKPVVEPKTEPEAAEAKPAA